MSLSARRARNGACRAFAAVLIAATGALTVAPVTFAESRPSPEARSQRTFERGKPVELWRAFPLGTARLAPKAPSVAAAQAPAAATAGPAGVQLAPSDNAATGLPNPLWYILVGLAAGLACGSAALFVMPRLRRRDAPEPAHAPPPRPARDAPSERAEDMSVDLVERVAAYHAPNGVPVAVAAVAVAVAASAGPVSDPDAVHDAMPSEAATAPPAGPDEHEPAGHVLLAPAPQGYELFEVGGEPPTPGETLDGNELGLDGLYTVASIGPSPLEDDPRECAFLVRAQ
jgi:hypothetical protein